MSILVQPGRSHIAQESGASVKTGSGPSFHSSENFHCAENMLYLYGAGRCVMNVYRPDFGPERERGLGGCREFT